MSCSEEIAIDRENPKWHYYFLCGLKGIQVRETHCILGSVQSPLSVPDVFVSLEQEEFGLAPLAGMSCLVDGTIPPSSGLSSSSALVCCAGLVTMEANQKSLSKVNVCIQEANKGFHSFHGHPTFSITLMLLL